MKELRVLAIAAMTLVCALATAASSQAAPDNKSKPAPASPQTARDNKSKPAPNAWMLTPTPYLEWNKNIAPSIRAERDKDADEEAAAGGQELPLTALHPDALGRGHGGGMWKTEIPPAPNRVVLTGTFTNHRSVLSASEFSLYTEVTVRVDEVFEDRGASSAVHGGDVTIMLSGGTVVLATGRVLTYNTQPIEFSLQPDPDETQATRTSFSC